MTVIVFVSRKAEIAVTVEDLLKDTLSEWTALLTTA